MLVVSRISGKTIVGKLEIELDVNTDIYPMVQGQNYALVLANFITSDPNEEFDLFRHNAPGATAGGDVAMGSGSNLLDQFDYVMQGKIFEDKLEDAPKKEDGQVLSVFISFGGLLMSIKGGFNNLKDLEMDSRVYLCMKNIG